MSNELTDQESRFAWEPTDFVWEKAPVEFSAEQKAALSERPDSVLASDNRNVRLPIDEVAIAGADGREVARLLRKAKEHGAEVFRSIITPAVERLLSGRVWFASNLFNEDERTAFIESIAEAIRPADLLGRSRVWLRYKRDEENTIPVEQFSDATPFVAMFADPIEPLKPEKAIEYFKSLAPKLGVDPERYAGELRRRAFTMAEATEKTILTQVKKIINDSLNDGSMRGDIKIQDVLTKAGVSPENPQYCFLPGTRVEGAIVAMSKARYNGPAVEIQTNDGRRLSVSVNHPILTTGGWKAAGDIHEGDDLVCYGSPVEPLNSRGTKRWAVDDKKVPARVEDVFEALLGQSGTILDSQRPVGALDFHGDAAFMDGKIDRIRPNWMLQRGIDPEATKHSLEQMLVLRNNTTTIPASHRSRLLNLRGIRSDNTNLTGAESGKNAFLLRRRSLRPKPLMVIGMSAELDASIFKARSKTAGGDAKLASHLVRSLAGVVSTNRVSKVKRFWWTGHVYDLQTEHGFLVSEGIVSSNCEMVYRTNMMDAFNTAQDEEMARPEIQEAFPAWRYDGIEDERTGEDHLPHIGRYYKSSQSFASIRGDRVFNCVLPGQMIQGRVNGALKAIYSGEVIEIDCGGNRPLTVTANHPVLTDHGFVAAGSLKEGDHLARYTGEGEVFVLREYDQHRPAVIEDVFETLAVVERRPAWASAPIAAFKLYGDEAFLDGEVDVVGSYRKLLIDGVPYNPERSGKPIFSRTLVDLQSVPSGSALHFDSVRVDHAAPAFVGGAHLTSPLAACEPAPLNLFRFGLGAELDITRGEALNDHRTSDTELASQLIDRFSGKVSFAKIRKINRQFYHGHVYDLSTDVGYFVAEDIIISNCRCSPRLLHKFEWERLLAEGATLFED